jgi:glucokinase
VFASQESPSLEAIVTSFLGGSGVKVRRCAVGVAGPVVAGRSQVVNLRWPVDGRRLARLLRLPHAQVLNDLEATAWGIPVLSPRQVVSLTPGVKPRTGNAALLAAGTGLGMAILFWDGKRHLPLASEGGHQDLATGNEVEDDLLRFLRRRYEHVSKERVVAGPGFSAIHEFLVESGRGVKTPAMVRKLGAGDPNAVVSKAGLSGEDETAARALEIFVSMYGAAAGDLALVAKATAGVYVGGGIAPKILPALKSGAFVRAFRAKGRLAPFLSKVPVRVILEPRTALLGAAACAARADSPLRVESMRAPSSRR